MSATAPLITRQRVVAFKAESTPGTAISLSAADGVIHAFDANITPDIGMKERQGQGSMSNLNSVATTRGADGEFMTELQGDGAGGPLAALATLLTASGFVAGSGGLYSLTSDPTTTLTYARYIDGHKEFMAGAMCDLEFDFKAGEPVMISVKAKGVYQARTSTALITPTYPTSNPMVFSGATLTLASYTPRVSNVKISLNNALVLREDGTKTGGYLAATITGRSITVSMDPEEDAIGTKDFIGELLANTEVAFTLVVDNGTDDCTFSIPKFQIDSAAPGDREGIFTRSIEGKANRSSADNDEMTITFGSA